MNAALTSSVGDTLIGAGLLLILGSVAVSVARYGRWLRLKVGKLEAQFGNNGGSSLRDAVDRIEHRQIGFDGKIEGIETKLHVHTLEIERLAEVATSVADRLSALEQPKPVRAPRKKASS